MQLNRIVLSLLAILLFGSAEQVAAQEGTPRTTCSSKLSTVDVISLLQSTRNHLGQSFAPEDWAVASAIAQAESALCPSAESAINTDGTVDRGLFQVNSRHGFDVACLFDAVCNTQAAITLYHQSRNAGYNGFRPWTVYRTGAYLAHLDEGRGATSAALAPRFYLGTGIARVGVGRNSFVVSPRLGISFTSGVGLRALLNLNPSSRRAQMASANLLYQSGQPISLYGGVGADAFFPEGIISFNESTQYGGHALTGVELRLGPLGVFSEVQPGINLIRMQIYLSARAGMNLHF